MSVIQNHPRKIIAGGVLAAAIAIASPFIAGQEGKRNISYRDIVGVPTECYGHTGKDVVVGRYRSDEYCKGELTLDVAQHAQAILPCIKVPTPAPSLGAFVSFSYNVGAGGFCRSSVARDLNAGRLRQACADLSLYVYAGGQRVQGLANRRAKERALCEKGLK